jgi:class 3 adenylate cyclase
MGNDSLKRKLTAILYADIAGYSRLTGDDKELPSLIKMFREQTGG